MRALSSVLGLFVFFLLVNWKFPKLYKAVLEVEIKPPTQRFMRWRKLVPGDVRRKSTWGQIKYLEFNSRCVFEIWFEERDQGEGNDFLASRQLHGHVPLKSLGEFCCAGMDFMRMELQTSTCFHCCKLHENPSQLITQPKSPNLSETSGNYVEYSN